MSGYWLFDTNCLSFLLTEFRNGKSIKIEEFTNGNKVLLTHLTLSELRLRWDLWKGLSDLCQSFDCYYINSETIHQLQIESGSKGIIYEEWFAPIRLTKKLFDQIESLEVPLKDDRSIKKSLFNLYQQPMEELILLREDETNTEVRLVMEICKKIAESGLELNIFWVNPRLFPYNYVHRYLIYQRYILNFGTRLKENDLYDIATLSISVFCDRYYSERSFTSTLREIKGKIPKKPEEIARILTRTGKLSEEKFKKYTDGTFVSKEIYPLLEKTEFFNLPELRLLFQPSS